MWIEKYKPDLDEVTCENHEVHKTKLVEWIINFWKEKEKFKKLEKKIKTSKTACVVVKGPHGCGKTTIVKGILQKLGIGVLLLNRKKISETGKIRNIARMINNFTLKDQSVKPSQSGKYVILIDNVENIPSKNKLSTFIAALVKSNKKTHDWPIIFISNMSHIKFVKMLEKAYNGAIIFPRLSRFFINKVIEKIATKEKLDISYDAISSLLEDNAYDLSKIITTLETLKTIFGESTVDYKYYKTIVSRKDYSEDLYTTTNDMFLNFNGIEESLERYSKDRNILPLMMQTNYLTWIEANCSDKKQRIELIEKISKLYSYSDYLEDNIRSNQNWLIYEIHGIYSCLLPSYYISKLKNKSKPLLKFVEDFNKTSNKCINLKNVKMFSNNTENRDMVDFTYMSHIIRKQILRGDSEKEICNQIVGYPFIGMTAFSNLLKLGNCKSDKIKVTSLKKFDKYLPITNTDIKKKEKKEKK